MKRSTNNTWFLILALSVIFTLNWKADGQDDLSSAEAIDRLLARQSALDRGTMRYRRISVMYSLESYKNLRSIFQDTSERNDVSGDVEAELRVRIDKKKARLLDANNGVFYWEKSKRRFRRERLPDVKQSPHGSVKKDMSITNIEDVTFDGNSVKVLTSPPWQLVVEPADAATRYPSIYDVDSSLLPWEQAVDIGPPPNVSMQDGKLIFEVENDDLVAMHEFDVALGYAPLVDRLTRNGATLKETLYAYSNTEKDRVATPTLISKAIYGSQNNEVRVDVWFVEMWKHNVAAEDLELPLPDQPYTYIDLRYADKASPQRIVPGFEDENLEIRKGRQWFLIGTWLAVCLLTAVVLFRRFRALSEF